MLIFPNPCQSFLELEISDYQRPFLIEIFDLNNKLVKREIIQNHKKNIDLTIFKSGIYIIKSHHYRTYKIVVNHTFN